MTYKSVETAVVTKFLRISKTCVFLRQPVDVDVLDTFSSTSVRISRGQVFDGQDENMTHYLQRGGR